MRMRWALGKAWPEQPRALAFFVPLVQESLFGHDEPAFDASFPRIERRTLEAGAWIEYAPGWLRGHARVFDVLARTTAWQSGREKMYDRIVDVPRVFASLPADGPGHPILEAIRRALALRYGEAFERSSVAMYRSGQDSVAFHGDRVARRLSDAIVATVSVGAPRRFLLRRFSDGKGQGKSIAYNLGWGDLFVMGGSCQRTWQHAVPKVAHAGPRIAIMYRPIWNAGANDPEP